MAHSYWVYILASRTRVLYIGVTRDLARRLQQHRENHESFVTRYRVTKLVYAEEFASIVDAITREKQIKAWRREKKVALIESLNPDWSDFSNISKCGTSPYRRDGLRRPSVPRQARDDGSGGYALNYAAAILTGEMGFTDLRSLDKLGMTDFFDEIGWPII